MEWNESAFLLLSMIFLLVGLLVMASVFHARVNVINLLVFLTDGFELGIGFCVSLFMRSILLVQKFLIVPAVGAYFQQLSSDRLILLQFLFMLSLVLRLCLVELDFLQAVHNRFQIS